MKALFRSCVALLLLAAAASPSAPLSAQTDLDAFMKKVLARRDDNWKKLQQYILNERELVEVRGPGQLPIWGDRRDYTWYLRDGFFVRSPVKFNGVTVSEPDRKKYEENYLRREKAREKRRAQRDNANNDTAGAAPTSAAADQAPTSVDTLITQTREPQFISSAYFLRFKFEEGKYALVGKEPFEGRDVLKIEYYPARLFSDDTDRNTRRTEKGEVLSKDQQGDQAIERAMNKVSMVTIWVEPKTNQIVKYTFNNVNMDFLPAAWLLRLNDLKASMVMSQPFPAMADVWLPKDLEMYASMMIAIGQFDMRYKISYLDYKLAETSSRIK